MIRTRSVPCADCEREKAALEAQAIPVLGCKPDAGAPGFCILSFDAPESETGAAPAASASSAGAGAAVVPAGLAALAPTLVSAAPPRRAAAAPAVVTETQRRSAEAIVNLFETGSVLGDYGRVTVIAGDTGHLSYGRSQATLGSGNLHRLLARYGANPGARFGARVRAVLPRFAATDLTLDHDRALHNLLRACADDPVMRETQDTFFRQAYWEPALRTAARAGIVSPLGAAVVYDAHVHGSWAAIRDLTNLTKGTVAVLGERAWIAAYVAARRAWLAGHRRADLRATVYRMDTFQRLIDQDAWGLELPLVVRQAEISPATLGGLPPGCYDGPLPGSRPITLVSPVMRGLDVRLLQLGLSDLGASLVADGIYGRVSFDAVKAHQRASGLPVTGVADVALIASLAS